ncbi:MAG: hypothetical protein PHF86_07495 [Candidatus Nanoarchaeia archaeon]|nr:hypothetical protein [Candidatus Nanoarchaeia archaeon]
MGKLEKEATYLDEIGACREAVGYDQEQTGKKHEEEVASSNNWENDERDEVGKAAFISNRKKRLANKLMRISKELEALGKMEEDYASGVEEMSDDDFDYDFDEDEEKIDENDPMAVEMGTDEWLDPSGKEAAHPLEHGEDDVEYSPSTMGDDEWISIGPGTFDDSRDEVGKAASKKNRSKRICC